MSRSTNKLKKIIYDKLIADTTLKTLLGGVGKIRHGQPQQVSDYPLVVYFIVGEADEIYDPTRPTNITETIVAIQVFSQNVVPDQSDAIEDRVYTILHGANLSDTNIKVFTCFRTSKTPYYDSEIQVWRIETRYSVKNCVK